MKKLLLFLMLTMGVGTSLISCRDTTEDVDDTEVSEDAEDIELEAEGDL